MVHALDMIKFVISNWPVIIHGLIAICSALVALCSAVTGLLLLIPGAQPENGVKAIGDFFHRMASFLERFSKKSDSDSVDSSPVSPPSDQPKL